jgi:hypothetical protein
MQVKAHRRIHAYDEDDKVFEVVDRVLTQIFGEKATHLIYRHLERNYSLRSCEIAEKIDVFAKGLEDFLNSGAYVVERRILEDLQLGCELTSEPELARADFVDQVRFLVAKA